MLIWKIFQNISKYLQIKSSRILRSGCQASSLIPPTLALSQAGTERTDWALQNITAIAKMQGKSRNNPAWQDIEVYEWVLPDPNRDVVEGKHRLRTFLFVTYLDSYHVNRHSTNKKTPTVGESVYNW